ncbi:MAG: tyrosine-type recombinase/integrase [Firmicutes bacterium]|nr:tyrosine-type recombinase/integrase [Bacillota bacterium]
MINKQIEDTISALTEQVAALTKTNAELTSALIAGKSLSCATKPYSRTKKNPKGKEEMRYYIPEGCSFFQRKSDGRWEARIMVNGKQQFVATSPDKNEVYKKLQKAVRERKKTQKVKDDKEMTLFAWLDHWHNVYRKPKEGIELSKNTLIMDLSMIKKIKTIFKDVRLRDLTADTVQQKLYAMTEGRTCEGVYTILKLALSKAKDRTGGISIMDLVEKVKHERVKGRALTKDEVTQLLEAARNDMECNVIRFYIYTGCRVDEISATKVKYINLTNEIRIIDGLTDVYGKPVRDMTLLPGEILIHGTKTKGSIRTMPIMPPLRPILEQLIKDRDGEERLFPYTTVVIRNFYKLIKDKTKISFTLKDFRHTAATNFKDAGIPSSVYFRWFGWCDDTMAKRVYTHETDYEKKLSLDWAEKFKD